MRRVRGSALFVVLVVMTLLCMLIATVAASTVFHLRSASTGEDRARQELAARAGLQAAVHQLASEPNRTAPLSGQLANGHGYKVLFFNNNTGNLGASYSAPDGTPVPPGHVYLQSLAADGAGATQSVGFSAEAWQPPITMTTAAFGDESVSLKDSSAQHYDSPIPPREFIPPGRIAEAAMAMAPASMGMTAGRPPSMQATAKFTKALLGTNSSAMDSLWAEGKSTISGNVAYGVGAPVTAKSGQLSVIGAKASSAQSDPGLSPFSPTGPKDRSVAAHTLVPSTVKFNGQVEVYPSKVPFPARKPITGGSGQSYQFDPPSPDTNMASNRVTNMAMSSSSADSSGPVAPPVPTQPAALVDASAFDAQQAALETVIPPGRYGKLDLKPGSVVRLQPGEYILDELLMDHASLVLEGSSNSPVVLTVRKKLSAQTSEINRYKHASSAYAPDRVWRGNDLYAQGGVPDRLEMYFQGEPIDPQKTSDFKATEVTASDTYVSGALTGKKTTTNMVGGALHGAILTRALNLEQSKLYHAKTFQSASKALSQKGPWTLKSTNRMGQSQAAGLLLDSDPWKAIEEAWANGRSRP